MGDFFHGWRRKIGVVTLVMALVFVSGWVRSLCAEDICDPRFAQLREGGVEPPHRLRYRILNPARLPVSPLSR